MNKVTLDDWLDSWSRGYPTKVACPMCGETHRPGQFAGFVFRGRLIWVMFCPRARRYLRVRVIDGATGWRPEVVEMTREEAHREAVSLEEGGAVEL